MKKYNWAMLGCGHIAGKFSGDLKLLPNANLYAAASRDLNKANNFVEEYGYERAYGSYQEMVNDPNVDVVYIATPHSHHYEHAILCLEHKKAVLCEKAFAMNSQEVKKMIDCARKNNTFLMEAFWTMFQPSFLKAMEIVNSGELGQLKMLRSDFSFNAPFHKEKRLYNTSLGGGSLLDIGIYPVFASLVALGVPELIKTFAGFSETGSEESLSMIFKYKNGSMANLSSSYAVQSPIQTEFYCEKGYLVLNPRWHSPTNITIVKGQEKPQVVDVDKGNGAGYQYEAKHVMDCLDQGKIESDKMNWDTSLKLMDILDRVRKDAGIFYEGHDREMFF